MKSFACAVWLVLPVAAAAQQPPAPPPDEPVVVTAGDGIVQAIPDRAWITVSAESRASNPRDAQRKNADAMKPVQDRLRAARRGAVDRILRIEEQGVSSPPVPRVVYEAVTRRPAPRRPAACRPGTG